MFWQLLVTLKPFILIVAAIPTGLFVRTAGQWVLDWAKAPTERAKQERQKGAAMDALQSSITTAKIYCMQIEGDLSGIPMETEFMADQLRAAAIEATKLNVIPSLDLQSVLLDVSSGDVFALLSKQEARQVMTTKLALTHIARRVDNHHRFLFTKL